MDNQESQSFEPSNIPPESHHSSSRLVSLAIVALVVIAGALYFVFSKSGVQEVTKEPAYGALSEINWVQAEFLPERSYALSFFYPAEWKFDCCDDRDTLSNHTLYKGENIEDSDSRIVVTTHYVVDPNSTQDIPSSLSTKEQFEILKNQYAEGGSFAGTTTLAGATAFVYSIAQDVKVAVVLVDDQIYSIRFENIEDVFMDEFIRKIADATSDWQVYTNLEYGYYFKYPNTVRFIGEISANDYSITVTTDIDRFRECTLTYECSAPVLRIVADQELGKFVPTKLKMINGQTAYDMSGRVTNEERFVFFKEDDTILQVFLTDPNPILHQVLNTLVVEDVVKLPLSSGE